MGGLIRYFQPETQVTRTEAYLYALGISLCSLFVAFYHQPVFLRLQAIGMELRVCACALIYRKVGYHSVILVPS